VRDEDVKFGDLLRRIRTDRGFTQQKMAEKIDLSIRQYQNLEANTQLPGYSVFKSIVEQLQVNPCELFFRKEDVPNPKLEEIQHLITRCSDQQLDMLGAMVKVILNSNENNR
jgi:transcriptional regulator with XRE-family HTH domain